MTIDFEPDDVAVAVARRTRQFVDTVAMPVENEIEPSAHGPSDDLRLKLPESARAAGLFAPTAAVGLGGLGLDHRGQALVLEEAGRRLLGPVALNCAALDEGNILPLDRIASAEQRERYLARSPAGRSGPRSR